MKTLVRNNITTLGIVISLGCLIGAIPSFKYEYLVLGFILCAVATISFFIAIGGKR